MTEKLLEYTYEIGTWGPDTLRVYVIFHENSHSVEVVGTANVTPPYGAYALATLYGDLSPESMEEELPRREYLIQLIVKYHGKVKAGYLIQDLETILQARVARRCLTEEWVGSQGYWTTGQYDGWLIQDMLDDASLKVTAQRLVYEALEEHLALDPVEARAYLYGMLKSYLSNWDCCNAGGEDRAACTKLLEAEIADGLADVPVAVARVDVAEGKSYDHK